MGREDLVKPEGASAVGRRIGLLAGWGRYPIVIAEALRRQGHDVYCLGVRGHADPALANVVTKFGWTGLARLGYARRFCTAHRIADVMMAGKIHKRLLFQPRFLWRNLPDLATIRLFAPQFITRKKDCKDDTLLLAVVEFFAERGIRFGPPTDYVPELLVKPGPLTRRVPNAAQWKDIRFGWEIAKEMGRLDIGQSVMVKNQAVLAVEAIEGTDECIRRAGQLCPAGGFTIVKVAKPQQDMRFDVPTVGLQTLENMVASGGKVLALEAGRTIVLDEPQVVQYAEQNGLILVAVEMEQLRASE